MAEIPTVDQVAKENFEHWSVEDAKLLAHRQESYDVGGTKRVKAGETRKDAGAPARISIDRSWYGLL